MFPCKINDYHNHSGYMYDMYYAVLDLGSHILMKSSTPINSFSVRYNKLERSPKLPQPNLYSRLYLYRCM